ncbi:hypothetical protein VB713_17890 [Anabaena cylindrica UHCC 0172]|uniref:hypothetical protein n=1 Tax=Anabaena cylindrica TaxID=1165 RepID=UPI002B2085D6|nr:hypothetical protein [Anabaena cylindrica]MEA5552818.1 hypothetical protein [Anabaena cylindrica UHCC 0172]
MATQHQAMFETPASHYNHSQTNPEFENEWEDNSEFENEWETNTYNNSGFPNQMEASQMEFENEWEGNPEFENEWETNDYGNPEFEDEWETNDYSNLGMTEEGEYFWKGLRKFGKRLGKGFRKFGKLALPLAKKLAAPAAKALVGMIPGVGAVAAPLAGKLVGSLVREAEMEVAQMEANMFGTNEAEAEVANNEIAYEAALTEFLADQAAESPTEAEAEAAIAATLPITVSMMGGKRALRPVIPVMAQATGRLTKIMSQQGPAGKQLLRTIPSIQRQAVATLKAAARSGQPINSATAVQAMASATNRVLSNPQKVQRAVVRNAVIRQRTAPPHPGHVANSKKCPTCATTVR